MAADQERAERIRQLKDEHPGITWRYIADQVGVSERAAHDWAKKGGITYDNAKRLARVFGVDPDWLWAGARTTPSVADEGMPNWAEKLFAELAAVRSQLDAIGERSAQIDRLTEAADRFEQAARDRPTDFPFGPLGDVPQGAPTRQRSERSSPRKGAGRTRRTA